MSAATDVLWRNAIAALPLALAAWLVCRWTSCRPATKHAMWTLVLIWLVMPPVLPGAFWSDAASAVDESPRDVAVSRQSKTAPTPPGTAARAQADPPERLATTDGTAERLFHSWIETAPPGENGWLSKPSAGAEPGEAGPLATPPAPERLADATSGSLAAAASDVVARSPAELVRSEPRPSGSGHRAAEHQPLPHGRGSDRAAAAGTSSRFRSQLRGWAFGLAGVRDAVGKLPSLPSGLWLAGSVLICVVTLVRTVRFGRRIGRGRAPPAEVSQQVARASRSLGLRRAPVTVMVDDCCSPMVWCGRRPRLILPSGLWSHLDAAGREAVLVHELAHLRRRDHWVRWVELFVTCVHWWNPVVWYARRRIHEEADLSCDAWVTWLRPRRRRAYAEALVATKQWLSLEHIPVPAVGMGVTSLRARRFAGRLTMVMTQSWAPRLSMTGIAAAMMLALTGWLSTPAPACPPKAKDKNAGQPPRVLLKAIDAPRDRVGFVVAPAATPGLVGGPLMVAPVVVPADDTYRAHLAVRSGLVAAPLAVPTPIGPGLAVIGLAGATDDDDVEKRLRKLEKANRELSRKLDRIADLLERRSAGPRAANQPPRGRSRGGAGVAPSESRRRTGRGRGGAALQAPRAVQPVEPQRPARPARPSRAARGRANRPTPPEPPAPRGGVRTSREEWRSYKLPKGKLKALTDLMRRNDVPIFIRPADDRIEVQGTERQHRIFKSFVDMISPPKSDGGRPGARSTPAPRPSGRGATSGSRRGTGRPGAQRDDAVRRDVEAAMADARIVEAENKIEALMQQIRAFEAQSEALEIQAEGIEESAEELIERAEELTQEAEEADNKDKARVLRQQVKEFESQAKRLEKDAKRVERAAEKAEREAAKLETKVEKLRTKTKSAKRR